METLAAALSQEKPAAIADTAPSALKGPDPFVSRLLSEGVQEEALAYLRARGLLSERRLAAVANSHDAFVELVVTPFIAGFEVSGLTHKSTQDPALVRALLVIAWQLAQEACRAAAVPAFISAAPPPSAVPVAPQVLLPARAPTALAPGEWKLQIEQFESRWTPRRAFPQKLLLGAEAVLARLLHELRTTRLFTPLGLGEILRVRAYTTLGQVNPLATKQRDSAFNLVTGKDGAAELSLRSSAWSPTSQWAILDGLEAAKWAFVFAGYTDCDEVADAWAEWFRCLVRLRADRLDFVKAVYDAASWRLALDMRSGFSFAEATKAIVRDTPWLAAFETQYRAPSREPQDAEDSQRSDRGERRHRDKADHQRGRARSRSRRKADPPRSRSPRRQQERGQSTGKPGSPAKAGGGPSQWPHSVDAEGKTICRNFNMARCRAADCKRIHVCAICLSAAHGASIH